MSAGRKIPGFFVAIVLATFAFAQFAPFADATVPGVSTISGVAFQDSNRNGVQDSGEAGFANQGLYLFTSTGTYVAATGTDAAGRYQFTALADGSYSVQFTDTAWRTLRNDWVPTTTGSLYFKRAVSLVGSATADFGLRAIMRSSVTSSPITTVTDPTGLVVNSYDDAVTATQVRDVLLSGALHGPELASTKVYFDFGTQTDCVSSWSGSPGSYSGYSASLWVAYSSWLDNYDEVLFHEFGHAWANYNAAIVQQDTSYGSYLQARGVAGDPRLNTSKMWTPSEMIAEDFRQLFGSAASSAYPQANTDVPPAAQVSGLADFLRNTYAQPPTGTGSGGSTPPPPPAPTVAVSALSVNPQPVVKSGTVGFTISTDATVIAVVKDLSGATVRTLLSSVATTAGPVSATWNRTNSKGKRVASGTYSAVVTATDSGGHTSTATYLFPVT